MNEFKRTFAEGQTDLTRHEAFTKVTGLTEKNSLTPVYEKEDNRPALDKMLEIVKKYIPDARKIILYYPTVSADAHDLTSAYIGVEIKHPDGEHVVYPLEEYCLIESDDSQKAHILMNCSPDPDMPAGHTTTRYMVLLAQCTGRLYVESGSIQADIEKIPTSDFTKLWNFSVDLTNTTMELYFKQG